MVTITTWPAWSAGYDRPTFSTVAAISGSRNSDGAKIAFWSGRAGSVWVSPRPPPPGAARVSEAVLLVKDRDHPANSQGGRARTPMTESGGRSSTRRTGDSDLDLPGARLASTAQEGRHVRDGSSDAGYLAATTSTPWPPATPAWLP